MTRAEEILKSMEDELRVSIPSYLKPHIIEAMREYAIEAIKNDRGRIEENSEDLVCFFGEDMYGNPEFTIGGKALEELKIELP